MPVWVRVIIIVLAVIIGILIALIIIGRRCRRNSRLHRQILKLLHRLYQCLSLTRKNES